MNKNNLPAPFVDRDDIAWEPHPRYPSVDFKPLLSASDNRFASVGLVRLPSGGVIGIHIHPNEVEMIYALSGEGVLTIQEKEYPFMKGQVVSIPIGMEHGLRNESEGEMEIITIFTPPLF